MAFYKDIIGQLSRDGRNVIASLCIRKKDSDKFHFLFAMEKGILIAAEKAQWLTSSKNEYAFLPYSVLTDCDGYSEIGILNIGAVHISCNFSKYVTGSQNMSPVLESNALNRGGYMSKEETKSIQDTTLKKLSDDANLRFAGMDILDADDLYEPWRVFPNKKCSEAQVFVNAVREKIGLRPIQDFVASRYKNRLEDDIDTLTNHVESPMESAASALKGVAKILKGNRESEGAFSSGQSETTLDQIKKLAELRDAGVLTEEEFETKKKELLGRI